MRELVAEARALRFESINADLIYGLPKQTPESFKRTIAQVSELRPTRIALYAYAHLPQRFKPQRRIDDHALPTAEQRINNAAHSDWRVSSPMAMSTLAWTTSPLPGDALAIAKRQGRLHRNFQGYTTQPDCDLISLGVSAIGRIGATYSQNAKTLPEYHDAPRTGQLPHRARPGPHARRPAAPRRHHGHHVPRAGGVRVHRTGSQLVKVHEVFAHEMEEMKSLQKMGLVEITDHDIQVTQMGWFFVRAVAMVFDRNLQADRVRERFSRII